MKKVNLAKKRETKTLEAVEEIRKCVRLLFQKKHRLLIDTSEWTKNIGAELRGLK